MEDFVVHQDFPGEIPPSLDEVKHRYVKHVLNLCDGNKSVAAGFLGISTETIYRLQREGKLK